jgi:hypothetical protein
MSTIIISDILINDEKTLWGTFEEWTQCGRSDTSYHFSAINKIVIRLACGAEMTIKRDNSKRKGDRTVDYLDFFITRSEGLSETSTGLLGEQPSLILNLC